MATVPGEQPVSSPTAMRQTKTGRSTERGYRRRTMRPAAPERTGIFTDFDGTLSAIVEDPAAARPIRGAVDVLARLAERYARAPGISGRPVLFLAQQVGVSERLLLCGLYGLERMRGDEPVTVPEAERWPG